MLFMPDPVALPGLLALGIGGVAFFAALFAARRRGRKDQPDSGGRRDPRSIAWILLQGVAIGFAGLGRIDASLDPATPTALASGAIVLILMLAAVFLFDWSSRTMGRNWALVARTRGDASLVTNGPFAYVRNPIYVALGLFMVAMAIAYGHTRNLYLAVPLYCLATWLRVSLEEKVLRAEFGAAYDAYAARVRRFVPGLI